MKNWLEATKTLLADDGVIFVQCDDNEEAYLERIQAAQSSQELVQIWQEMAEGSFLNRTRISCT